MQGTQNSTDVSLIMVCEARSLQNAPCPSTMSDFYGQVLHTYW